MYELTIFKNQFDNKTHRYMKFPDWESFMHLLEQLSKTPLAGKKDAQLISPAVYVADSTRSNKNVEYWGKWAAVDVDEYQGNLSEILDTFSDRNFCVYSTASSTPEKIKFRLVFELTRAVAADEIRHFWYALNRYLGELGDPQTKDSSRMYYIPAEYQGAYNFFQCNSGGLAIDVDQLKQMYEYVPPPSGNSFLDKLPIEMQKQVIEHRKSKLNNTSIQWSSYRDCPFFPKKLSQEYMSINETGWYHTMFRIMVAVACNAIKSDYPITANQIESLCREFDSETGNWYQNRPFTVEANSALEFAYKNVSFDEN